MRKWIVLALGAFMAGGGLVHGVPALLPLGAGVGIFGYIWFSLGARLVRLAKGEEMGCLHLARELGYETGGACSRCESGAGYALEIRAALGAWAAMALCAAGAAVAIAMRWTHFLATG